MLDAFSAKVASELLDESALVGGIIPPFSYEPDASYLCGHYPEETNSGTHFWFGPDDSPYAYLHRFDTILDRMPRFVQLGVRRGLRIRHFATARIPFKLLPYFDKVRKCAPFEDEFCEFPTIFDLLGREEKRWVYIGAPVSSAKSDEVLAKLQRTLLKRVDFILLFIGDLDEIGHKYGPASKEYYNGVKGMRKVAQQAIEYIERRIGKTRILVFGDHGMVPISQTIDIQKQLKNLKCKPIQDYVYFLDSTLARFWFFNKQARQEVTELLESVRGGSVITNEERCEYKINYPHNRFGELIWWANGGTLILPNFWQGRNPVKGMHGYRKDVTDNHAGFLLMDPNLKTTKELKEPVDMVDIFATMVDMLGFDMPPGAHGHSVYKLISDG